jgi:purine-binding chemotaxis protein CheW
MAPMTAPDAPAALQDANAFDYVTIILADQLFGLPIRRVHDVFLTNSITAVPLAPPQIVGLLNLRGRVVTAISLRQRLGMPPAAPSETGQMALGIEDSVEAYALIVDKIGEVLKLDASTLEANPVHLDPAWAQVSSGIHRLDGRIMVILDVDAVLNFSLKLAA